MRLAARHVGLEILERADIHRLDGGDPGEALDLALGESNVLAEMNHAEAATDDAPDILAKFVGLVARSTPVDRKIFSVPMP